MNNTRALHSDYEVIFADDDYMHRHIQQYYNRATLALYRQIRIPAARSDLARLMLLYQHGGTYLDCSFNLLEPLHSVLGEKDEIVLVRRDDNYASRRVPDKVNVINGLMAAPPKTEFFKWCTHRAISNLVTGDLNNRVAQATGAGVVNMALYKQADQHTFRFLMFSELKGVLFTRLRKPGVTNNWLEAQDEGIIDSTLLRDRGSRVEKSWVWGGRLFQFSFSCLNLKDGD